MTKQTATTDNVLNVLQDLMQMTHDGFVRLEERICELETRMSSVEGEIREVKLTLQDHGLRLGRIENRLR